MHHLFAASLLAWSAAAIGQTTTTNCTTYPGSIHCTSQTPQQSNGVNWSILNNSPNPGQSFLDAFQKGQRERAEREAAQRAAEAAAAARAVSQAQMQAADKARLDDEQHRVQSLEAAKMVTAGDCAGAQTYALSVGNFTLAQQVKNYCAK